MHLGPYHQFLRRRGMVPKLKHKTALRLVDMLAYTASTLSLIFTLDQGRIIWATHSAGSVSLLSWFFYTISASVWLLYGYIHKDRVLMITNTAWVAFSLFVLVGVIVYQ